TWGGVTSGSHHEVVIGAANAMLEPELSARELLAPGSSGASTGPSGVIRRQVIDAASDPSAWSRLSQNLDREHELAALLPPSWPQQPAASSAAPHEAQVAPVGTEANATTEPAGPRAMLNGKGAAKLIGIGPWSLSRWRGKT